MSQGTSCQVVGLGQCSLDILGRLDRYPDLDQKAELGELLVQGGGPVATALVTLQRLGVATAMLGRVGDDPFGDRIRAGLVDEGVDCRGLQASPGGSQLAFVAVDGAGHRNIFWHRGTAQPERLDREDEAAIRCARILHLDGLHLAAAVAAAQLARTAGVTTVLDAGTLRPGVEQLLPLIDHLVVSETFARQAADDIDAALTSLTGHGAQVVTVTLGAKGCVTRTADGAEFTQPAFPVAVVDTTGCGDVFHGGYLYGLLQSWPLPRTLRFAAACAALKCRALGGRTAIPRFGEVERFLREAG